MGRAPDTWDAMDRRSERYRLCCTAKGVGTALAVQLMRAKHFWQQMPISTTVTAG